MSELLTHASFILRSARYTVREASQGNLSAIAFEDEAVVGFVCEFESAAAIVTNWKGAERSLLSAFAPKLRAAGDKSWNAYCVFLTPALASEAALQALRDVEEDLERTRKIAASGLTSRDKIEVALLPLLPIQAKPVIQTEEVSVRLKRRVSGIAPGLEEIVLDETVEPTTVARRLAGRS